MKFKTLLITTSMMCVALPQAYAGKWFVKVDSPSGNDGKTWETAFNLADCITSLSSMAKGDDVYFAGGKYTYPALQASGNALVTGLKMQNNPVNLHGGYATNLTGTEVPEISYPSDTPTILDGDRNNNGIPDGGDVRNLIFVQTTNVKSEAAAAPQSVLIEGFTLQNAYYNGTKGTELGALNVDMTRTVTVRNCIFRNNKCENAGAAFSNSGSQTHFIDCIFEENTGKDAGIAVNQSKRGDADKYFKPSATLERCLVASNNAVGEGKVAGGSAIRVNAGSVYIINSTVTGNKGYKQGAIHINDATGLYIASSTISDNSEEYPANGSAIYATGTPSIRIINSYVLGMENDPDIAAISLAEMTTKVSDVLVSDGGNIFGKCDFFAAETGGEAFVDNFSNDVVIPGYDDYKSANTPYAIFGRSGLQDKGGFSKVLVPQVMAQYFKKNDFAGLFKTEYKCPVDVIDTVDQRNEERPEMISVGAYDQGAGSGVSDVMLQVETAIAKVGDGIYRLAQESTSIIVYDISGNVVWNGRGSEVNLSGKSRGIYLIRTDDATFKVLR